MVRRPRRERGIDGAMACPFRRRGDGAELLEVELGDRHIASKALDTLSRH
jgi:hypothetical protein